MVVRGLAARLAQFLPFVASVCVKHETVVLSGRLSVPYGRTQKRPISLGEIRSAREESSGVSRTTRARSVE